MRLERRERNAPAWGLVFGGVLLATVTIVAVWLSLPLPRPVCVFREWTGIACPTCGSTRLAEAFLAGDLLGAFASNPVVFLVLVSVAVWAVASGVRLAVRHPGWRAVLTPGERLALRVLAVAALAAGWIYLIWRGT
jgi:hypothetical protein